MKNKQLEELNFRKLIHYSPIPKMGARSIFPLNCARFCVSCEQQGFLNGREYGLGQISHGADTQDFESSISELPSSGVTDPVAFLLESPGGHYDQLSVKAHLDFKKRVPTGHYYWTTPGGSPDASWPKDPAELKNKYGDYFAYLIRRHNLRNAYFTNIIKCNLVRAGEKRFIPFNPTSESRDSRILEQCCTEFLFEEMQIVQPRIIFFFGKRAAAFGSLAEISSRCRARAVTLWHPAARFRLARMIGHNDDLIETALGEVQK